MARSAHREAVACFEQALAALAQLPERRDTRSRPSICGSTCAVPCCRSANMRSVFDHLRAAEALAERLGDPQRLGRLRAISASLSRSWANMTVPCGWPARPALATASGAFDVQVIAQMAWACVLCRRGLSRKGWTACDGIAFAPR